jgi:hypothetical protein
MATHDLDHRRARRHARMPPGHRPGDRTKENSGTSSPGCGRAARPAANRLPSVNAVRRLFGGTSEYFPLFGIQEALCSGFRALRAAGNFRPVRAAHPGDSPATLLFRSGPVSTVLQRICSSSQPPQCSKCPNRWSGCGSRHNPNCSANFLLNSGSPPIPRNLLIAENKLTN